MYRERHKAGEVKLQLAHDEAVPKAINLLLPRQNIISSQKVRVTGYVVPYESKGACNYHLNSSIHLRRLKATTLLRDSPGALYNQCYMKVNTGYKCGEERPAGCLQALGNGALLYMVFKVNAEANVITTGSTCEVPRGLNSAASDRLQNAFGAKCAE